MLSTQLTPDEVYPRHRSYGFDLSPDGERLSFLFQRDLIISRKDDDDKAAFAFSPIVDLNVFFSSSSSIRVFYSSCENVQCMPIWSRDGSRFVWVQQNKIKIVDASTGETSSINQQGVVVPKLTIGDQRWGSVQWSPDNKLLAFVVREDTQSILCVMPTSGNFLRKIHRTTDAILTWDWSPDGTQVVIVTRNEDAWVGEVRLVDVETGNATVICSENNYEYCRPIAVWRPDGRGIVVRSNRSGWAKLLNIDPKTGETHPLTVGEWDDYAFRFSPDGGRILYTSRESQDGSSDDLWILDLDSGSKRRITQHKGVNIPIGWSSDDQIYYWHSSPRESGDLWSISLIDMTSRQLSWNVPIDLERRLAIPEEIKVNNQDIVVPSLLYKPVDYQNNKRYPGIVWIRGGPTRERRFEYEPFYSWLANQGYIVIVPNYRGSIGNGVSYMAAVSGDGVGKNDLSDVLAAAAYLSALPCVDTSRGLGVGGCSWGGYLALLAATKSPTTFACAIAGSAISDWFVQQSQTEVRYYDRWLLGGWTYQESERARDRSPVNFIDQLAIPILVYHGDCDRDVPFLQAENFAKQAQKHNLNVEYIVYKGEGHNIRNPVNQRDMLERERLFLKRHLQEWNLSDNPCGDQVQY